MRYPASEKLEIIRLVEGARLPAKRVLAKLGVSWPTFYRWYDLYRRFGEWRASENIAENFWKLGVSTEQIVGRQDTS